MLKPIVLDGNTVGHVGYVPRPEIIESIERVYMERQHVTFSSIAIGMLVAALALGAGLAHWLTRRIHALARGTNALSHGDYHVRLDARGHDELAQLARDFNALAATLAAARQARQQWIADIAHELPRRFRASRELNRSKTSAPARSTRWRRYGRGGAVVAREDLHNLSMADLGALSYRREPSIWQK